MKITQIEACFKLLVAHARAQGIEEVEAGERELYWTVTSPEWLAIYNEPKPAVGSFGDDEAGLKKLLEDPQRASAVDLDRLASILRLLSDILAN